MARSCWNQRSLPSRGARCRGRSRGRRRRSPHPAPQRRWRTVQSRASSGHELGALGASAHRSSCGGLDRRRERAFSAREPSGALTPRDWRRAGRLLEHAKKALGASEQLVEGNDHDVVQRVAVELERSLPRGIFGNLVPIQAGDNVALGVNCMAGSGSQRNTVSVAVVRG
jgi:hypothetical protein